MEGVLITLDQFFSVGSNELEMSYIDIKSAALMDDLETFMGIETAFEKGTDKSERPLIQYHLVSRTLELIETLISIIDSTRIDADQKIKQIKFSSCGSIPISRFYEIHYCGVIRL